MKLRRAGVEPKVDLPGVGLNFQDHYLTFSVYRAKPETESFDDFVRGVPEVQKSKSTASDLLLYTNRGNRGVR